ncbi:MAG: threonine synthase [bacterium]|nr:threonine synthase [bacterium]
MRCIECGEEYPGAGVRYRCDCGGTLDVLHELEPLRGRVGADLFDERRGSRAAEDRSGVWRFRELILPVEPRLMITRGEGNTHLYDSPAAAAYAGLDRILLKHEGENPTGSFKDRGMTVGATMARVLGMDRVACASTGNTSASMAAYAASAGMRAFVFIPAGNVAYGKLSQALAYGARTLQIDGDFDAAMTLVEQVCAKENIYLLNSINPFRIEGQKAIGLELMQDLGWEVPDWLILPGGNLGNSSAIAKGLSEARELGLISQLPRIAVIQAAGASPLYRAFTTGLPLEPMEADTLATAIRIGRPLSWKKSLRGVVESDGVVESVTDQEIMDAKAHVDSAGIGAEPASCATLAGAKKLVARGVISRSDTVCGVLTGHLLKDPDAVVGYHKGELNEIRSNYANAPEPIPATLDAILEAIHRD